MSFGGGGGGGGGSTTQTTRTEERVGLHGPQREALSAFLSPRFVEKYEPYLKSQLETPFAMPALGQYGVYPEQEAGLLSGFNDLTSRTSANYAQRGFLTPRSAPLVASTAVRDFAPQYAAVVGQNVANQQTIPEEIRRQRYAQYLGGIQTILDAIGSQSTNIQTGSSSQSSGGGSGGIGLSEIATLAKIGAMFI